MNAQDKSKVLLVEGADDKRTLPELLEKCGIPWPGHPNHPIFLQEHEGITGVLQDDLIEAYLKSSVTKALGLVVDADEDASKTWDRVKGRLVKAGLQPPEALPKGGVVLDGPPRVGVWIMPDNFRRGMLESLLLDLCDIQPKLKAFAKMAVSNSKNHDAPWRDCHRDKAELMTWLAWQDPPGEQKHIAVKSGKLLPVAAVTDPFVTWVKTLFEV